MDHERLCLDAGGLGAGRRRGGGPLWPQAGVRGGRAVVHRSLGRVRVRPEPADPGDGACAAGHGGGPSDPSQPGAAGRGLRRQGQGPGGGNLGRRQRPHQRRRPGAGRLADPDDFLAGGVLHQPAGGRHRGLAGAGQRQGEQGRALRPGGLGRRRGGHPRPCGDHLGFDRRAEAGGGRTGAGGQRARRSGARCLHRRRKKGGQPHDPIDAFQVADVFRGQCPDLRALRRARRSPVPVAVRADPRPRLSAVSRRRGALTVVDRPGGAVADRRAHRLTDRGAADADRGSPAGRSRVRPDGDPFPGWKLLDVGVPWPCGPGGGPGRRSGPAHRCGAGLGGRWSSRPWRQLPPP